MLFSVYRFTEFEVFWSSTVSVYRSRTLVFVRTAFAHLTSFLLTQLTTPGSWILLQYLSILVGKMNHPSLL